ncbi:MAG: SDR family oxidoreductase [Actinomycetota bacterium]|nr:SDR family oxidoreductase [Actinomycetota bacterium]
MAEDINNVIVTGGSSGIGLATAKAYAARGCDVAIVGRNPEKLASARKEIEAARRSPEQRVLTARADLSVFDQARAAIERFTDEGLVPDVLVNSAGVILPGEFAKMPLTRITENLENGFLSVVYPCRAAVPYMIARGSGHIVNVSSIAGFLGIYGYTGYSAAKYAVMGFTEALRFEMKPEGVSVHVVCPPDTDTPALAAEKTMRPVETDVIAGNIKAIPPEKVAEAILRGVDKDKYYIIPDALSRFYFRLKGVWPEIFFSIVDGDVRKARKG